MTSDRLARLGCFAEEQKACRCDADECQKQASNSNAYRVANQVRMVA